MKLENEFTVKAPLERAWQTMLDIERVAPCVPGASLLGRVGEREYEGTITVKVGPVAVTFKGRVRLEEVAEAAHRVVMQAMGKDVRGQDTVSATVVSLMDAADGATHVRVETDMRIAGRLAQFGRGIMQSVAARLMDQFAACLEREIATDSAP